MSFPKLYLVIPLCTSCWVPGFERSQHSIQSPPPALLHLPNFENTSAVETIAQFSSFHKDFVFVGVAVNNIKQRWSWSVGFYSLVCGAVAGFPWK